jgi:hypothetical protein
VHGFEADDLEDEKVQGALYEIGWLAQSLLLSVTDRRLTFDSEKGKRAADGRRFAPIKKPF